MSVNVDLHMHTTHSDGSCSPEELMRQCKEKNLACVSVTDHDTMSGFEACEREAVRQGIELIPGIEISVIFEPGTLHILGYYLNRQHPELCKKLEEIQKARRERNLNIIKKLNEAGLEITMGEVASEASGGDPGLSGKQIGRPHYAKVLLKKGYVRNLEEAFSKYLGRGRAAYVDKRLLASQEAIELINRAGGVASVAHPKQMRLDEGPLDKEMKKLARQGLGGIEVYNSCQSHQENGIYLKIARRYNLVPTGGSDFHGSNKPGVELGFLGKGVNAGYEMVEALQRRIQQQAA